MADEPGKVAESQEAAALSELPLCENLSQVAAWTARWAARLSGADPVFVWTPDPVHPLFLSTGAFGEGLRAHARKAVGRDDPLVRDALRDRQPRLLSAAELPEAFASSGGAAAWTVLLPATNEGAVVCLLTLAFATRPRLDDAVARIARFLRHSAAALDRALKAERRIVGMRQAIERLTNLYDVSKAFGSTIEGDELAGIVARKAVDFSGAEAGSLWLLEGDDSATLAATAINENYEVADPPDSVGASLIGDVLADRVPFRRNRAEEADPYRSLLGVPLIEEERPIGALVVVNKRGRVAEFSPEDEDLLEDLARQAVRALRNARQYEAEKKVEELDALLAVSREITATLDLDKVMNAIVNATAALISYDRCAIAILDRGKLRLGAVSGIAELDRKSPDIRRTEDLLQWVFLAGENVQASEDPDGSFHADRPETEEKFRQFFSESGSKSFFGLLLEDEEGKLGVLGFESREPIGVGGETRDLLQILVNQATVAVRNAQLYQQVPLAGFLKPFRGRAGGAGQMSRRRRNAWIAGGAIAAILLVAVPWRLRVGGPARMVPGRRSVVAAGVDGVVSAVRRREGDVVAAGDEIATIEDGKYAAALAAARADYQIAAAEAGRFREAGNPSATADAEARRTELAAKISSEEEHLAHARLVAPVAGVIVTPHLEDRVGQYFARGAELCVVADVSRIVAEVSVPESDASLIREGQPADLKLNSYPTRTFHGNVTRVGARLHDDGKDRFLVAEVAVANPDGALKTGMLGKGKILAGHRSILTLLLRKPGRWAYQKIWPLLP